MYRIVFFAVAIIVSHGVLYAQQPKASVPEAILALKSLDNFGMQGAVNNISSAGKIVGTVYLNDDWMTTTIKLTNQDVISDYQTKYNLHSKVFEIKTPLGVKVLEAYRVSGFSWNTPNSKPRTFISERVFNVSSNDENFYEVLSEGTLYLLKRTDLTIKKPDYSVQFNVGSKDTQISKKQSLYYFASGKFTDLPVKMKKFLSLFGDKQQDVQSFISENQLDHTKEHDLIETFNFYNGLGG